MLIVPLNNKISWKDPPYITIAIIIINCFVLFFLQSGDTWIEREAYTFYFDSGLADIEMSSYEDYLADKSEEVSPSKKKKNKSSDEEIYEKFSQMNQDDDFMRKLEHEEIITPQDDIYPEWKELSGQFNTKLSRSISVRFGFKPSQWRITTLFTYMFLHGGIWHLIGNMIFLWLVGCMLELALGRPMFVALYILGGLFAAALFGLVNLGSTTGLVGASGAIAGLMGAYTVLYGKRKIKVFYSLGFYFNYTTVPAIYVLPLWIINEFVQLFFWGDQSNVAYMAHVGGLVSGAVIGFLNVRFCPQVDHKVLDSDPKDDIAPMMEEALGRIERLDIDGARPILNTVLDLEPDNRDAVRHLYNIDRLSPEKDEFHESTLRYLDLLIKDTKEHERLHEVFTRYIQYAKTPMFKSNTLLHLVIYFAQTGYLDDSEKILGMLMLKKQGSPKLPRGILHLAKAFYRRGMKEKARQYLDIIRTDFPDSYEYKMAVELLDSMP